MGKQDKSAKAGSMNSKRPKYEIQNVTLYGYDGERREVDVREEFSLIERICYVNPNFDRTGKIKDEWLKRFNEFRKQEEKFLKILRFGGIRDILWVDINFKFKVI